MELYLQRAEHGILYSDDLSVMLPRTVTVDGVTYNRFMDRLFIPTVPDKLSDEQVITLNLLRFTLGLSSTRVNFRVRSLFSRLLEIAGPNSILELGPSYDPLLQPHSSKVHYQTADLDPAAVKHTRAMGYQSWHFPSTGQLPIDSISIDLVIAMFVFHYDIAEFQVREIRRVLRPGGCIVANIYRRDKASRESLLREFAASGFRHSLYPDSERTCRNHYFACIFQDFSPMVIRLHSFLRQES